MRTRRRRHDSRQLLHADTRDLRREPRALEVPRVVRPKDSVDFRVRLGDTDSKSYERAHFTEHVSGLDSELECRPPLCADDHPPQVSRNIGNGNSFQPVEVPERLLGADGLHDFVDVVDRVHYFAGCLSDRVDDLYDCCR